MLKENTASKKRDPASFGFGVFWFRIRVQGLGFRVMNDDSVDSRNPDLRDPYVHVALESQT